MIEGSQFNCCVAIDWSGAKGRKHKGIAIAEARGENPPRLVRPNHIWSRQEVLDWLLKRAATEPTLFGFDFSFAPPFDERGAYLPGEPDVPDNARDFWAYVDAKSSDEDLGAASFLEEVHRRHFYFGIADGAWPHVPAREHLFEDAAVCRVVIDDENAQPIERFRLGRHQCGREDQGRHQHQGQGDPIDAESPVHVERGEPHRVHRAPRATQRAFVLDREPHRPAEGDQGADRCRRDSEPLSPCEDGGEQGEDHRGHQQAVEEDRDHETTPAATAIAHAPTTTTMR